jgi:3-dehydroquinate synthase
MTQFALQPAIQPTVDPTIQPALMVGLDQRSYPIFIAQYADIAPCMWQGLHQRTVAIITNQTVAPLYLQPIKTMLSTVAAHVIEIILPDGEDFKTWDSLNEILSTLLVHHADRKTTLIALGGGVIGDMTGFAAAIYQRGVPFIQIPTTLLSQVDSSVGGKTAINHPLGKNMIGAFYQPKQVWIDLSVLRTLPRREMSAGMAEVIKYGCILDADFFAWLAQHHNQAMAQDQMTLQYMVRRCCELKAQVVAQDETEQGIRAWLNFGHTFGHAIEMGLGFGTWLHGEAVGCGMVLAARLSYQLGGLTHAQFMAIVRLIQAVDLPVIAPDWSTSRWIELMQGDKKTEAGQIQFIVLQGIGQALKTTVDASQLEQLFAWSQSVIQQPERLLAQ